jgi:hypothetical protein
MPSCLHAANKDARTRMDLIDLVNEGSDSIRCRIRFAAITTTSGRESFSERWMN